MKNKIMSIWKSLVVGVWIFTLYISCVFLVIYSLSSYQFQEKLKSIPNISAKNDSVFIEHECDLSSVTVKESASIIKVLCLPKKTQLDEKYYSPGMVLGIYKEKIELVNTEFNILKSKEKSLQDEIAKLKKIRHSPIDIDKDAINDDIDNLKGNIYAIHKIQKKLIEKQKNSFKDHELSEINILKSREKSLQDEIAKLEKKRDSAIEIKDINDNIDNLKGNIYAIHKIQKELIEMQKDTFKDHELLVETFSDIEYFDSFFNIFSDMFGVKSIWAMPKQILEIVLILSMGILGSLMFVTIEFINEKGKVKSGKIAMYIFRPSLGMIVALSVYVMAKSGQSTFTGSDTEYLSPYLISFLGIISGLLAEKAYAKLTQTGSTLLITSAQNTLIEKEGK